MGAVCASRFVDVCSLPASRGKEQRLVRRRAKHSTWHRRRCVLGCRLLYTGLEGDRHSCRSGGALPGWRRRRVWRTLTLFRPSFIFPLHHRVPLSARAFRTSRDSRTRNK
ncbi:hypothetical protein PsYK624_108490 [Phanerochaete sordida]|uniref:Uncharacterized protein n=1 Tax=Phanerochaete sordida TaxID=48140 RepID=A0A9P3LH83_9APHY|nr:hypothetical protein PsYK624_108490 [Phanerochaete sordida]